MLLVIAVVGAVPYSVASAQEKKVDPGPERKLIPIRVSPLDGKASLKRHTRSYRQVLPAELIRTARIPSSVTTAVGGLSEDSYEVRQAASADLRSSPVPDEVLMAVLDRQQLGHEQRHRLLRILNWRIHNRPRGAVGIRMSPGKDGVLINELVPGLPAEKVLRVGDTIIKINDFGVKENSDLVGVVQRLVPGTLIRMSVLRLKAGVVGEEPERVDVEFPLGSYSKLGNEPDVLGLSNPETSRRNALMQAVEARYGSKPKLLEGQLTTESGVIHGDG